MSRRVLFALAFLSSLAPFIARAQPLADKVPAGTLMYVGWRGADHPPAAFAGSHLKAVLDASDFSQFTHEFLPAVLAKLGQADPQAAQILPLVSAIAQPMWKHPVAWCVEGIDLGDGNTPPTPHVFILCDAGNDAAQLGDLLNNLTAAAAGAPVPVAAVHEGSIVGITVGPRSPALDALLKGKGGASLAADPKFKATMSHVTADPVGVIYVDVEAASALAEKAVAQFAPPDAKTQWPAIRDALGLSSLKSIAYAGGFEGKDWLDAVFLSAPAPRQGLLASFGDKPLKADALSVVPKTAVAFSAARFSLGGFVDGILSGITKLQPQAGPQIDAALNQVSQGLGFDVRKDFLAAFGDEWVAYTDPATGGYGLGGTVLVNRAADAAKLEQSLSRLETLINALAEANLQKENVHLSFQTRQAGGATLHYLATPLITPTWAIDGGNLYVALFPQAVVTAINGGKGGSILESPRFVEFRKRFGDGDKATAISYVDLQQTAPINYGGWLVLSRAVGFSDLFGIKSPLFMMPPLAALMDHLGPAGAVSWADDAGWHLKSLSPFPSSSILGTDPITAYYTTAAPMTVGIMLPSLSRARETANRVKSSSNLRQIGQGCLLHANENKGNLPDDLGALIKQDLPPTVFLAPNGSGEVPADVMAATPDQQAAWVNQHADYVYVGKGLNVGRLRADQPLAYEKPEVNHGQGVNVLFGDGHVDWLTMPEAQRIIGATRGNP